MPPRLLRLLSDSAATSQLSRVRASLSSLETCSSFLDESCIWPIAQPLWTRDLVQHPVPHWKWFNHFRLIMISISFCYSLCLYFPSICKLLLCFYECKQILLVKYVNICMWGKNGLIYFTLFVDIAVVIQGWPCNLGDPELKSVFPFSGAVNINLWKGKTSHATTSGIQWSMKQYWSSHLNL